MVDVLVVTSVVSFVERVELTEFNDRTHASVSEFVPKRISVVAFVGDGGVQLLQIFGEHLPADLGGVQRFIEKCTSMTAVE